MAKPRPDAFQLVRRDAGADAAAADQNPPFRVPAQHGMPHFFSEVGVVHRGGGIRANVEHLVPLLFQFFNDGTLEVKACVIATDNNEHEYEFS